MNLKQKANPTLHKSTTRLYTASLKRGGFLVAIRFVQRRICKSTHKIVQKRAIERVLLTKRRENRECIKSVLESIIAKNVDKFKRIY